MNYKNTNGKKKMEKYMISEDHSAPSNMPRGAKVMMYPKVACGGTLVNDSPNVSDKISNERVKQFKYQSLGDKPF